MSADAMQVGVEGWNHHIERQIDHRWAPVLDAWFPTRAGGFAAWIWQFLQYVFPLDDPRGISCPRDPAWSDSERATLERYVTQARDLAASTVLTARNGFSVYIARPGSDPEITETVSPRDSTVGFLTMFRQCYSPAEPASFNRAYDLLAREMHRANCDLNPLRQWRRAHATLRHTHLDHLILVQAALDEHVPKHLAERNASHPSQIEPPEQLIAALFYGDSIHWGEKRTVIEAWDNISPVIAVKRRYDALRAAVHLGHFYVGFAGIVGLASGDLAEEDL